MDRRAIRRERMKQRIEDKKKNVFEKNFQRPQSEKEIAWRRTLCQKIFQQIFAQQLLFETDIPMVKIVANQIKDYLEAALQDEGLSFNTFRKMNALQQQYTEQRIVLTTTQNIAIDIQQGRFVFFSAIPEETETQEENESENR